MDLIRILRSLEEFLYELMSWVIFYPRTLFRTLVHPAAVAKYTQLQLKQAPDDQFTETIPPTLMLILSVVIAHGIEMAANVRTVLDASPLYSELFGTDWGLLASRSVIFALYALIAAVSIMRRTRMRIDHETLREPFYIQAYLAAPFAVLFSASMVALRAHDASIQAGGWVLSLAACAWYVWARGEVYHHLLHVGRLRALLTALAVFLVSSVGIFLLMLAL